MATLATDKSIFQIKSLHRSARTLCLILALVSNISVRCSLDHTVLVAGWNRRVTAPTPEVQWIEMTSPKLPFNSEADPFTKCQCSGKIKHHG